MTLKKIKTPEGTFDKDIPFDVVRSYPSLECLNSKQQLELETRVRRLMDFESNARIPPQVVDYFSRNLTSKSGFSEMNVFNANPESKKQKYFFRDLWNGGSLIAVKEGRRPVTDGLHIIVTHSDVPCLMVKPKPIKLEFDFDKIYSYLGVRLSAIPHGGIAVHQWVGQQVNVLGYHHSKDGRKREIKFPGVVGDFSRHVDYRGEESVDDAFTPEDSLEIIPGHRSIDDTLKRLEFESIDDFAQSTLWAVPNNEPFAIDEYNWNLLVGYGHDDRVCCFSAMDALTKSRNPEYTAMVWITDKEESGDGPPSGASGPFFDNVMEYLIQKENVRREREAGDAESEAVSAREISLMYLKSSVIIGDVNIAPYGQDYSKMDHRSAPKIGLGTFISGAGDEVSDSKFLGKLVSIAKNGLSLRTNINYQVCGNTYSQDIEGLWFDEDQLPILGKVGQWGYIGVPCAVTHSHNEIICPSDEYWTSQLYRRFFQSSLSLESL